jgi:hypothetical protein
MGLRFAVESLRFAVSSCSQLVVTWLIPFPKRRLGPFFDSLSRAVWLQILRLLIPDFNQTEIENAPLAERRKRRMFLT